MDGHTDASLLFAVATSAPESKRGALFTFIYRAFCFLLFHFQLGLILYHRQPLNNDEVEILFRHSRECQQAVAELLSEMRREISPDNGFVHSFHSFGVT